jgi:tetratricopeptide (TPR) repeat protein
MPDNSKILKIKNQISIGDTITIYLSSGKEITGDITNFFEDHLELTTESKSFTAFENLIAGWEIHKKNLLVGDIIEKFDPSIINFPHCENALEKSNDLIAGSTYIEKPPNDSKDPSAISVTNEKTINDFQDLDKDLIITEKSNDFVPDPKVNEISEEIIQLPQVVEEQNLEFQNNISENSSSDQNENFSDFLNEFDLILKNNILKKSEPIRSLPKYIPLGHKERMKSEWDTIINRYDFYTNSQNFSGLKRLSEKIVILGEDVPKNDIFFFNAGCFLLNAEDSTAADMFKAAILRGRKKEYYNNLAIAYLKIQDFRKAQIALENLISLGNEILIPEIVYKLCELSVINNNFKGFYEILNKIETATTDNIIDLKNSTTGLLEITKAMIFALNSKNKQDTAKIIFALIQTDTTDQKNLLKMLREAIKKLPVDDFYDDDESSDQFSTSKKANDLLAGQIYKYNKEKRYGFIQDFEEKNYFFHKTAIKDDDLKKRLDNFGVQPSGLLLIDFLFSESPRGLIAIEVFEHLTNEEIFKKATDFADFGDYSSALYQIRRLVNQDPRNKKYSDIFSKWQEYAKIENLPKGSNPYARAKRAQIIEKDYETAIEFYEKAIETKDNFEVAVRELALLFDELGRTGDSIDLLNRNRELVRDKVSIENLLLNFYKKTDDEKALQILEKRLKRTISKEEKIKVLSEKGGILVKNNPSKARDAFYQIIQLDPQNINAKRALAASLSKLGEYEKAEAIINTILIKNPNDSALDILIAIKKAKETGSVDDYIIDASFFQTSGDKNEYAEFFLDRCSFQGVPFQHFSKDESGFSHYKANSRYARDDIQSIEILAKRSTTQRPRDRGNYYLSAAKISLDNGADSDQYNKYLVMSFTSLGDATIIENKPLDSAMTWYCESLRIYNNLKNESLEKSETIDALNSFVRFFYATLGREKSLPSLNSQKSDNVVVETLEKVFQQHPNTEKLFDNIAYLISNTSFGFKEISKFIFEKRTYYAIALNYLQKNGVKTENRIYSFQEFTELLAQLRRESYEKFRSISHEIRTLRQFKFSSAWLENSNKVIIDLQQKYIFSDLDIRRLSELQKIFDSSLKLAKETSFEEKERIDFQLKNRCEQLKSEIEFNPTRLAIEEFFPIIDNIRKEINKNINELYRTSTPQITISMAIDSYYPDNNNRIEYQIAIENKTGCSPAESMEIIIEPNEDLFTLLRYEIKVPGSLRGSENISLPITLEVSEDAINSQIFPISLYAQYKTRTDEEKTTPVQSFSVKLSPQEKFELISNPYSRYAEGGPVQDPEMFYGREDLIKSIITTIRETPHQGKCIVIFGQKRSGKSSILYHINQQLKNDPKILILDLGNIGRILDPSSETPLLYVILRGILFQFQTRLKDFYDNGYPNLNIESLSDMEFYKHPFPLQKFLEIFKDFENKKLKEERWKNVKPVIMIDEFSYIYNLIVEKKLNPEFMKNWKAFLQENLFDAILAGQDVMPKFKQRFPNEFGTTQDERVTYLKKSYAESLIDEPIKIGGKKGESRLKQKAIERIYELTAGSPYYIQMIGNRLVEYMNRNYSKYATEADIEFIKNELINGENALTIDKFDNLISSGDTSDDSINENDARLALEQIAINSIRGPCNKDFIHIDTVTPLDSILDDLETRQVVTRENRIYYRINVELFKEWLVYHTKYSEGV